MTRWMTALGLSAIVLAPGLAAAASPAPAAGSWATYRRTSPVTQTVSGADRAAAGAGVRQGHLVGDQRVPERPRGLRDLRRGAGGPQDLCPPAHHPDIRPDSPPLSITQVTVDKATGKGCQERHPEAQGVSPTPEDGLRPFSRADIGGTPEAVTVPAGTFQAAKGMAQGSTVWVADKAGPLNLVKMVGPRGTMELVKEGTGGVKDLLRP